MHTPRPRFPVAQGAFVGAYVGVFGLAAVVQRNGEFMFYVVVMLVLIATLWAIDRRVGFSGPVLWLLAAWGLLHLAGGTIPVPASMTDGGEAKAVLYSLRLADWTPRYDQWIHVFGFFVATLAAGEALWVATRPVSAGIGFGVAAGLMGMGLGAANEVVEFIATLSLPETNVGGYVNTGWDLVSNTAGAAIGAVCVLARGPHRIRS